jgi:intein/homing endonuclease
MPRKIEEEIKHNPLFEAIRKIEADNPEIVDKEDRYKIVDIMTFVSSLNFLGIPYDENPVEEDITENDDMPEFKIFPGQAVILKSFYKGTMGNENLTFSQSEWEWLYDRKDDIEIDGITYERNMRDVIKKVHDKEKSEKFSPFTQLVLVLGRRGTKCRSEEDLIATTEGSLTFRELCDRINDGEKIGICTYDTKTWKRSVTYNVKAQDNGIVNCYKLTTSRGISEISSWNHPYLVWRDDFDEPKFLKLQDLKEGDRIAVADKTEIFGQESIGIKKAALLGHFQGDGSITHHVGYSTACTKMLKDFSNLITSEFPNYQVLHRDNYDYAVVKYGGRFNQDGSQNNQVKEWLKEEGVFGKKAIDKRVPASILKGSKKEVAAFLSRFFGCNGFASIDNYLNKYHMTPQTHIGCTLGSEQMINDIRHLLLKFGIHATVRYSPIKDKDGYNNSWQLKIIRKECLRIFEKEINMFSKETVVHEVVKISQARKESKSEFDDLPKGIWNRIKRISKENNRSLTFVSITSKRRLRKEFSANRVSIAENYEDNFLKDASKSDIKWDVVKSVEFAGEKSTVDLQVDPHHIIGGDIISHNTFMASIITAYEAYKLLVINNGDPHRYYNLPDDDEIAIINVALSQKQAGRLFGQVQARIRNSPFFKGRVAKETSDTIRLYTDRDLQKKREGSILSVPGSILLLCGHSNPDSLAGYSAILLLFDEIAFYDETGKVTGKYFVNRLKPSLSKFYKYKAGKVVMISSPNIKTGAFYDAFMEAKSGDAKISDACLSFQLPTWDINLDVPYEEPELIKERNANPEMFTIEFGAQWAEGGAYGNYFEEGAVERCLRLDIGPHERPQPATNYYLHVDPAKKSNNYAAVMVAKTKYVTPQGHKRIRCTLAGVWLWRPTPGLGLLFEEIDKEVINICARFHPMSVTYDDYHSVHSVQRLRSHGINCNQISFNDRVKCKVYQNLRNMMLFQPEPEIFIYDNSAETNLLINELKELKFKKTKRGYSILADKNGDVGTDDLSDCLAGAVSAASEGLRMALPSPTVVRTGWL